MSRLFLCAALFFCLLGVARMLQGQIRFIPPESQSEFTLGSLNPLFGPPGIADPTREMGSSTAPSWADPYGGFQLGSGTEHGGTNFGAPTYTPPAFPIMPGMTREQIVLKQAEMERMNRLAAEERLRQFRAAREARQNLQKNMRGLQGLFGESSYYVPQNLENAGSPTIEQELPPANRVQTELPVPQGSDATVTPPKRLGQVLERLNSVEQNLLNRDAQKKREEAQKNWADQRQEAEQGAELFTIYPVMALTPSQLRDGWCHLFDGQTWFGWKTSQSASDKGYFSIQKGEIRSNPQRPGLITTANQFGDSTILFEYQADSDAEAYLLLRTSPSPGDLQSTCYAIVLNSSDYSHPIGSVVGRQPDQTAQNRAVQNRAQNNQSRLVNRKQNTPSSPHWTRMKAQFAGKRLEITLNQNEPVTFIDDSPLGYGYIGLLVTKGDVRFRNILWKPDSAKPLFDPVDPKKFWHNSQNTVQIRPTNLGTMQLTGGPGIVESQESFRNFALQFEYNMAFTSGRSGLFFRSIPGQPQSGYEISLQNFPTRADRDQTVGVDAGAFRAVRNGRYVRPADQAWNHVTLLAVDRRFQTWINGVPVAELNDVRPPSPHADAGPFLLPGTLQFLAPTADTNVDFRNIRITPFASRFGARLTP